MPSRRLRRIDGLFACAVEAEVPLSGSLLLPPAGIFFLSACAAAEVVLDGATLLTEFDAEPFKRSLDSKGEL